MAGQQSVTAANEGKVADEANGSIAGFKSCGSASRAVMAHLPQTPTKEATWKQLDQFQNVMEHSTESGNVRLASAEHGSRLSATVLAPLSKPGSASRAEFGTEKLKESPQERRGFNGPSLSFGSVIANVPAPVLTGGNNQLSKKVELLEQPRLVHSPSPMGSVSHVGTSQTAESTTVSDSRGSTAPTASFKSLSSASEQYERPSTDQFATFATMDDIMGANPYLRRADDIGLRHQIPGVGHLGNNLLPPGWKEGDSPITPGHAKKLFDFDRRAAIHDLEMTLADQKHLSDEEKEKLAASIDNQWKARLLLDQTVLTERLLIYRQYHEREQRKPERSREEELNIPLYRLSEVPQPAQPCATTSFMPAPPMESPSWRRIPNSANQMSSWYGDPRTPHDVGPRPSQMGPEMSPSALDRRHISSRMGSVYNPYQPNYANNAQEALEDQQQLTNTYGSAYGPAYGPSVAHGQVSQRALPSSNSARPTVNFESFSVWTPQHGYLPEQNTSSQYRNDSFSYANYPHVGSFGVEYPQVRSSVSFEENALPRPVPYQTIQNGYGLSTNNNIYHNGYDPSLQGRPYGEYPRYKTSQTAVSPVRDQFGRGQSLPRKPQYEISKTGYSPIGDPHAPELSGLTGQESSNRVQQTNHGQEVERTTLNREFHLTQQSNHKKPGVKPTMNPELPAVNDGSPKPNKRMAEAKADKTGRWYNNEAELAKLPASIPNSEFVQAALEEAESERRGAKVTPRKRRPKPEVDAATGFSISGAAAKLLALNGIPYHRDSPKSVSRGALSGGKAPFANIAPAPGGLSNSYKPNPPAEANYIYTRRQGAEVIPESGNDSDHVEDPTDGDYGKRKTRRKTTTPRKNPAKSTASSSKSGTKRKRKSATPLAPYKRTRLSVDDLTHNPNDDAEGSDDPAMEDDGMRICEFTG